MSIRTAALVPVILLAAAASAFAQGLIIPDEPDLPPLALARHHVRVEIDQQGATTTIEQVFVNHTERQLEAQYVFPIPKGAVMSRFTMLVNGKEKAGELVERDKARQIYNSIVRRAQDPGLLEYLGGDVFRANIFPILPRGNQTVTLRFNQVLPAQDGLVSYVYPVRAGALRGPTVHGEFSIEATLRNATPLLNVYSPSHPVVVVRKDAHEARASYSQRYATLEKDFQLFYSVSDQDVGLNLVAFRPDPARPGYFLMLLSPRADVKVEKVVERDVVFVVDTSGSMRGDKFRQAKDALKYCVSKLNDGDRFNVVRFSTFAETWRRELVGAAAERDAALKWVDTLVAEGGTDIAGALDLGLSFPRDPARPYFVIFMTDGKPTMGETTDPRRILAKAEAARGAAGGESIRLFTWGVGYDVDTHLLDGLAAAASGVSEYVRPEEDIAAKVSAFANKASQPILTNIDLKLVGDRIRLEQVYPRSIGDLYAGGQIVVLGRYAGDGDAALELTGKVNGRSMRFVYEGKFAGQERKHAFVEPLWAKRRIGHLLDAIRLHGEKKELVDEVVRMSVEYGIQTPYTSYLILEDDRALSAGRGLHRADPRAEFGAKMKEAERKLDLAAAPTKPAAAPAPVEEQRRREAGDLDESLKGFADKDGKKAVDTASYLRRLKEEERLSEGARSGSFKRAVGRRFFEYRGLWVDESFEAKHAVTAVKFGSKAYFRLVEKRPELLDVFKMGTGVVYVTPAGRAIVVSETGVEELQDAQIDELFAAK